MLPAPGAATVPGSDNNHQTPPSAILNKSFFTATDLGGELDGLSGGSNGLSGVVARGQQVEGDPGLYQIILTNTGTGWVEKFLLFVPTLPVGQRAPLLVVFHRYGVSHWDAYFSTTFFREAAARGWFVVAPLGATQRSFSSLESQINVEAALNYTTQHLNIDLNRVYGVGFSMGGGSVTNYASRHVDPGGVMFAAIVNHTGDTSLADTYANESAEIQGILEQWFGGPPAGYAFNYQRSSVIDIDPGNGSIGVGTDLSQNLSHVPLRDWMANNDPMQYLRDQTTAFDAHINGQNLNNTLTIVNGDVHSWNTLSDHAVCDWLSQFSLLLPTAASTLADQDGAYFRFFVNQARPGSFTPFSWVLDPVNNRVTLYNTANLTRVSIDVTSAGLQYAGALKINMDTADGTGDDVLLENVPTAPTSVTRDGAAATGVYDPVARTFLVSETDNAVHMWRLNF